MVANDGSSGYELWKSDGTTEGTALLKDIFPAGDSSPGSLANINGTLFFSADDGVNGRELWKSDGTPAGTVLVQDTTPGAGGSYPENPMAFNGMVFFTSLGESNGRELWRSDGTSTGTMLVKDLAPGLSGSAPSGLTDVNGTLYFAASDGSSGYELWRSDGTPDGTTLVQDIAPGGMNANPAALTFTGDYLFLSADDGSTGRELWALRETNRLANGGFELDANNDGRPDSWSLSPQVTRSDAVVHNSSYAMRHFSHSNASYTVGQTVGNLAGGQPYTFSGWVNIPTTKDKFTLQLEVKWQDAFGQAIGTSVIKMYMAPTSGWGHAATKLTVPSGTASAEIRMVVSSLKAAIYVDDVEFE
ncbi:MAG: ELWxxDGT repeat protein [Roseiflexaceae bacterium]